MINFYKDGRVHAYFKGILQSIYNLKIRCMKLGIARRYPTVEYALENNIAHATIACFGSKIFTDERSSVLGDSCVPESGLGRQSFGGSLPKHQTISREITSKYQARSTGEANNKHRNGNQTAEDRQRKTRAEAEDCAEISRGEAKDVVFSDQLLTNFVPTSNILRVGFESASNFLRVKQYENSKPTRIKLDKKPKNGRIWSEERENKVGIRTGFSEDRLFSNSGQLRTVFVPASEDIRPAKYPLITFQLPFLGQPLCAGCVGGVQEMGEGRSRFEGSTNPVPRMYCLGTVSSRGRYRKSTGSVLRSYWRATKEVLRRYWKGTEFCKFGVSYAREVGSLSLEGSLSQISSFKPLNFLSQVFTRVECDNSMSRLKRSLSLTQEVGKGVGNKGVVRLFGSARFSITRILMLLMTFGVLNSQGQTSDKESAADGVSNLTALGIGDTIPESLWNHKWPVYNDSEGRSTLALNDYRNNKLIILDFWATWCSNCLESFPKLDVLKDEFGDDFGVLLVNSKPTRDDKEKIDRVLKKYKDSFQLNVNFPYLIGDTIFNALFPHRGIPHVVWIGNDRIVKAITYTTELQPSNVSQILTGQKASFYIKDDFKYNIQDNVSNDTLKLFSSYFSKRREGIREMGVQIKEKGNVNEFSFLNSSVAMRIYEYLSDSGHRIERNLWLFDELLGKDLRRKLKTPQRYTDEYCYFLRYPKHRTDFDPYQKMIHDIQDNFGVKWEIRKAVIDVWHIDSSPKVAKYTTKGKIPLTSLDAVDGKKFIQNMPLRNSFNVLSWFLNKPAVLGDIEKINIDFDLPTDLQDYTDIQLLKLFEKLGAKVTMMPKEVEYVYFSKNKGE